MGVTTDEEKDGIKNAVMAAKMMQTNETGSLQKATEKGAEPEKETVFIEVGTAWKETLQKLESEIEKELGKANAAVSDVIAREKEKCKADAEKEFKQVNEEKMAALKKEHEKEIESLKSDHTIELEKMKNLYEQQLNEAAESFRERNQQLRKEMDRYKEQIEMLMLHIDDPFVMQEIQMKQDQAAAEQEAAKQEAAKQEAEKDDEKDK